jgi:hypothetical protein
MRGYYFRCCGNVITPPSSVEVNYALSYPSVLPCTFMAWCLIKHIYNFVFTYAVMNSEQGYVITVVKNGYILGWSTKEVRLLWELVILATATFSLCFPSWICRSYHICFLFGKYQVRRLIESSFSCPQFPQEMSKYLIVKWVTAGVLIYSVVSSSSSSSLSSGPTFSVN